ncbi:MAG: sulfite exporter TauE/SafE family protein [Pirellulaceae bacterium]
MYLLATAVLTASLLGSMHCVGMCGPLAIWASGASENLPKRKVWSAGLLYHLGRLITYTLAGLLAGGIGSLVDLGGQALGYQLMAARLVGGAMIAVGLYRLWSMLVPSRVNTAAAPSRIGGLLVRMRPYIFRLPLPGRALATGLLTTLLPCGWLYLFALVAAGTGSIVLGPVVMIAFWIGTVPALVALVAGTQLLSRRFTLAIPAFAALLLVVGGCFTASGRGFASLGSLNQLHSAVEESQAGLQTTDAQIESISQTPLPCCQARQAKLNKSEEK